ncbi:dNA repair protein RadC [Mycoplasma sp. CAG:877]|nr:dNA repair protein RadC [Mycoplasma sp. CAG:877]
MIKIHYTIKDFPLEERPREKVKQYGINNVTNKELLSIILKTGTKSINVADLALSILRKYKLHELKDVTITELTKIKGIGEVKAIELLAAIELGKRINYKTEEKKKKLNNPEVIFQEMRYLFIDKKQELFYCLYLNEKQELIERKLLFMGTVNKSITHPREVFKEAYRLSASSIICMHNHPSNDLRPSKSDIEFTTSLVEIGKLQGIPVVDHIIVGDSSFYSFYEHNNILSI